jgi:hypothetical protein
VLVATDAQVRSTLRRNLTFILVDANVNDGNLPRVGLTAVERRENSVGGHSAIVRRQPDVGGPRDRVIVERVR